MSKEAPAGGDHRQAASSGDRAGAGWHGAGRVSSDRCHRAELLPLAKGIWRVKVDQARRMKDLERENARLRRAVSDLTLDKLILQEAARGNF